eukprot:7597430-Pyramimonas_sp.AAC.1
MSCSSVVRSICSRGNALSVDANAFVQSTLPAHISTSWPAILALHVPVTYALVLRVQSEVGQ